MKKVYRKALKPYIPYMARAGVEAAYMVDALRTKHADKVSTLTSVPSAKHHVQPR
jgi:hypothetical protein